VIILTATLPPLHTQHAALTCSKYIWEFCPELDEDIQVPGRKLDLVLTPPIPAWLQGWALGRSEKDCLVCKRLFGAGDDWLCKAMMGRSWRRSRREGLVLAFLREGGGLGEATAEEMIFILCFSLLLFLTITIRLLVSSHLFRDPSGAFRLVPIRAPAEPQPETIQRNVTQRNQQVTTVEASSFCFVVSSCPIAALNHTMNT
jgi:hypothetical protein